MIFVKPAELSNDSTWCGKLTSECRPKEKGKMKTKIYTIVYLGEGPKKDQYYDLYGPSNGWIGQYPSLEKARETVRSCVKIKGYKNVAIVEKRN